MKFCWATINVRDMETSLAFYEDIVGLAVNRVLKPAPGVEIAFLSTGETEVELMCNRNSPAPRHSGALSLGFETISVENVVTRLRSQGYTDIEGPFQPTPELKFIFVEDPDGARIQFVEKLET